MAAVSRRNCPYCYTQSVAFTAKVEWQAIGGQKRALFICGSCAEGIILEYMGNSPIQVNGDTSKTGIDLLRQWPEQPSGSAPNDTPSTVASYFEQGTSALSAGSYDAAGMMFRKTLESATKIIDSSLAQKPLVSRIDNLVLAGQLTSDMGVWAHDVRLGGNEAAHEDEPFTSSDAEDLRNFIENFLRYAFTLPSAVKRRALSDITDE